LGGQLLIESAPHRGTRLRMLVPLMSLETEES
jgi:signal transduction histidine kinase